MTKLRTNRHIAHTRCHNSWVINGKRKRCTSFTKHPTGWCKPCRDQEGYGG